MYKIILTFLIVLFFSGKALSADVGIQPVDPRLKALKQQVLKDILSGQVSETALTSLAANMKADGSWPDIDYADKTRGGWPVNDHLTRLMDMSINYVKPGNKLSNDQQFKKKIIAGLNFWLKNDFICPNWWYPEIGVPKVLGPIMLLMEDKLTPAEMGAGLKILNRAKIGMTGQNKVWLSGNVIYRSLLTSDVEKVQSAVSSIQEEVIISQGEGIQADYSFHQHGPQQQFGNYGAAFAGDMLKWAIIFQGTGFEFDNKKITILRNYLLQGMRWVSWKNTMDISACGRQLFPNAQIGKAKSLERIIREMPLADTAFKNAYVRETRNTSENKHFWRSDMTVHRRANFYSSVKMSSKRVAGAESCNEENISGYHLGDGATYFYQTGEEYRDIFPFWNWKLIPGTTTFHDAEPLPVLPCSGYRIASDFVGGASDSVNGIATLAYKRDSLNAQKSWFYFDDAIVCLGAGIKSNLDKEITTSINQSLLHGNVWVKQASTKLDLQNGQHHLSGVSWVIHDGLGYFFPGKADLEVSNRQQSGDWHKVLKRMPAKDISENIFTIWYNHQTRPVAAQYAYYVIPAATAQNIESKAAEIVIVENSERLQVIESQQKQMAGFVFVQAGAVKTNIFNKVSANKPCILLATRKGAAFHLTLSDPTHLQADITIGLEGRMKSNLIKVVYDATSNISYFRIPLPRGAEAGKSVNFTVD